MLATPTQRITEAARADHADLDLRSSAELVSLMSAQDATVPWAVAAAGDEIAAAVDEIVERMPRGGRLIYVGAGTSGRIAAVDAAECESTFSMPAERVVALVAGGTAASALEQEAAEDDADAGARELERLAPGPNDVVVGISASGRTPYVLGAVRAARDAGSVTVALVCAPGSELAALADRAIEVVVGPELVAGSTRLKAGTAQKLVLNMLSTVSMIRLGKTYGNLMVDVAADEREAARARARDRAGRNRRRGRAGRRGARGRRRERQGRDRLAARRGRRGRRARTPRVVPRQRARRAAMRLGVEAALVDGKLVPGDVEVRDGRIARYGIRRGNGRSGIAAPGFVDLQVNGFGGVDFATADAAGYERAGEALLETGVTAYLPTLITAPEPALAASLREVPRESRGPRVLGVHVEGPFLAAARMGTHLLEGRLDPDPDVLERLLDAGPVRLVTLAPELPGALELIDLLLARGVAVSCGHTDATAEEAEAAFDRGALAVTHLFNAMRPFRHRDPGIAGAALVRDDVVIQLILDGHHVADETALLVWRAAAGRLALVTDAMAGAGQGDGSYRLGDVEVEVRDGSARSSQDVLAGSVLTMLQAVRNLHALGVPLADALSAATAVPARVVGELEVGRIERGVRADVVVLDDNLEVDRVLVGGEALVAA